MLTDICADLLKKILLVTLYNVNEICHHWFSAKSLHVSLLCYHEWDLQIAQNDHHNDVLMSTKACQITSLTIVLSTVYSGANERKHQSSASLEYVRGIHRWPMNSPHLVPVMQKMSAFDVICKVMAILRSQCVNSMKSNDACMRQ